MQRAYNLGRKVWVISKFRRDGDRLLQLLIFNEECLVSASHQLALITSLPFVHTARRSYRLNDPVRPPDCGNVTGSPVAMPREAVQTLSFRGRRSRNKVSVGEPAEGSLRCIRPTRELLKGAFGVSRPQPHRPFPTHTNNRAEAMECRAFTDLCF